jgi:hypothetical protein
MRNNFFLCLFVLSLIACKDTKWMDAPAGVSPEGAITGQPGVDDPAQKTLINCQYIGGDPFELDRIPVENMVASNDLIYLVARPYANGDIAFDLPANDATFTGGVSHEATYQGRSGVLKFDGTGKMNGKDGLLHSTEETFNKSFTFATYIYIDEWVKDAYIFKKTSGDKVLAALKLGTNEETVSWTLGNASVKEGQYVEATGLKSGGWHYLAIDYDGTKKQFRIFVDTWSATLDQEIVLPTTRADFYIGEGLKGRLDETSFWSMAAGTGGKDGIKFDNWNMVAKVLAYWKYDDSTKPGKDSHTWVQRLEKIRETLAAQPGNDSRKLRLGFGSGQWRQMMGADVTRAAFANNLKSVLKEYEFDGVDLDIEWPTSDKDYSDYSATIVKIRQILGKDVCFSVSLHPVAYKITKNAIDALDFISYQCYGPAVMRYPYDQFVKDAEMAVEYGIPADKLVLGVPFIGTTGVSGEQVSYYDLVNQGGLKDITLDEFTYNGKEYTFNGQKTIRKKAKYACEGGYRGIMSWGSDLPISDTKSLLKAIQEEFTSYEVSNPE